MKIFGWIVLLTVAIPLQGVAVFWLRQSGGSFFSQVGLECTLFPAVIELVVAVATAIHYERIHSGAVGNPHSVIGKTLRNDAAQPPAPPPTRKAWDGEWDH